MPTTISCGSVSELPPVSSISRTDRVYTTLPVVVLALRQLSIGVLLVTDFTANMESGFMNGKSPQVLPDRFLFGGEFLDSSKVLAVGVPQGRIQRLWQDLAKHYPALEKYDYRTDECNLSSLGIVVELNFKISVYDGCLEGFLGVVHVCGPNSPKEVPYSVYDSFLSRYAKYVSLETYNRLTGQAPKRREPKRVEQERPNPVRVEKRDPEFAHPAKLRRLDPTRAIYQQQVTQQQATQPQYDPTLDLFNDELSDNTDTESWNLHSINTVDIDTFARIQCHAVKPGTTFEFSSTVAQIMPDPINIFVKPYGKTLKVASFKLVLEKQVLLELHTEAEACTFFDIDEIEVAINHIEEFTSAMKDLVGRHVRIKAEKKVMVLPTKQKRSYWGFASTLSDLQST